MAAWAEARLKQAVPHCPTKLPSHAQPFNPDTLGLALRGKSSNVAVLLVKAGEWGVRTSFSKLGHRNSEAGWHARMSSRLAGKGACAYAE